MKLRVCVLVAALLWVAAPSFAQKVTVDWDHDYDFATIGTYQWISPQTTPVNPLIQQRVEEAKDETARAEGALESAKQRLATPIPFRDLLLSMARTACPRFSTVKGLDLSKVRGYLSTSLFAKSHIRQFVRQGDFPDKRSVFCATQEVVVRTAVVFMHRNQDRLKQPQPTRHPCL